MLLLFITVFSDKYETFIITSEGSNYKFVHEEWKNGDLLLIYDYNLRKLHNSLCNVEVRKD